ncbi:MAG: elongation factor G [Chloroflexi bacterium]|nr:elongation factor G [Chloroflexota bacterium]
MTARSPEEIRNLVLLSHNGAGKTSLAEIVLFTAGAISRLGRVDEGTTTSDYDPDEIKHRMSINLSMLPCEWQGRKLNILDTPGYADFVGEVKSGMRVVEGAVIVICAASGVEVGSEQVWSYCEEASLPRLIFVNKMDRENANFTKAVDEVQAKFSPKCLPLQLPIGAQDTFQGLVDLLAMKSYQGNPVQEAAIPAGLAEQAASFRMKLVEAIAETDDALLEKYLGGEELSSSELSIGLKKAVAEGKVVPILVGSALKNIGITYLMDAIGQYVPSPKERPEKAGERVIGPDPDAPLAALVFKVTADPYVGKLTYFRVFSGTLNSNTQVWNATHGAMERVGQLYMVRGKTQEAVAQVAAGDMGAVAKLSVTGVSDMLCSQDNPMKLTPIVFPEPVFSMAVHPKTKLDLDKLGNALTRLAEEDPTMHVRREADTNETIVSGLGETHLRVAVDKMQRKFGANVELSLPKVPYKETITTTTQAEYKHKKQTGGHGQYGHVLLELEPLPRASGLEFVDRVVGGAVPKNYIPAVEKGVYEAAQEGVLGGFPVVDVRVALFDGSFHPVDSSDICFKIAGAGAVKKGLAQAQPILLEPIMTIKVTVPGDFTGDIMSDLNTKRARVLGMIPSDGMNEIEAQVPLAEIQRYALDLRSLTQGRGTFTMQFSHYEPVPQHVAQKISEERQAAAKKA